MARDVLSSGARACESHLGARGWCALGSIGEGRREDAVLHHCDDACVSCRLFAVVSRVSHRAALLALVGNILASLMVMLASASVAFPLLSGCLTSCGLRGIGSCRGTGRGWATAGRRGRLASGAGIGSCSSRFRLATVLVRAVSGASCRPNSIDLSLASGALLEPTLLIDGDC